MSHRRRRNRLRKVSAREERRRLGFRLLRRGVPKATVARQLGVTYLTVLHWAKRRQEHGPNSWRDLPHRGADPKLTAAQKKRLVALLTHGAKARGYPTDLWTLKRVAEVIRKEFGVEYTLSGVWRVLRALGFSAQVPLTRALERDETYIRWWVRKTWPEIFRTAEESGATIVFADESGIQTLPNVRRHWARTGTRPVMRARRHREKLSVISGVTLRGELIFEVHRHDITGTEVIWFLEQLMEEIPGKVVVLWDNGTIHQCPEVRTFTWLNRSRLTLRRFPPYAPELNPDEGVWDVIKNDRLANFCQTTLDELESAVMRELHRLRQDPSAVERALRQTELPIHTVEELMAAAGMD